MTGTVVNIVNVYLSYTLIAGATSNRCVVVLVTFTHKQIQYITDLVILAFKTCTQVQVKVQPCQPAGVCRGGREGGR